SSPQCLGRIGRTNKRRNLNSWQKATIAAEAEELLASIAQAQPKNQYEAEKVPTQKFVEANRSDRETSHQAASMFGTNRTYLNDAKKLKQESPEQFEAAARSLATVKTGGDAGDRGDAASRKALRGPHSAGTAGDAGDRARPASFRDAKKYPASRSQ